MPSSTARLRASVNGQITGFGLDFGVIDDPIKGRAEASSLANRDKTWNWLTDDFFSRFSDKAGMVMIGTRWHLDDPIGRWIDRFPETTVLNYPAIAEHIRGVMSFSDWQSNFSNSSVGYRADRRRRVVLTHSGASQRPS
jgi:hypothetical protein